MYPLIRLAKEIIRHRNSPPLTIGETHVTTLICWPWDIDMFMEMNNGRVLTLYDLGRFAMLSRHGITKVMSENRWAGTVAGASVRYRRRVRMFEKFEMRSRILGWDNKFTYSEQSMWRSGECTSHALFRIAITGKNGLVPVKDLALALNMPETSPPLPDWVNAWADADAKRIWPPMQDAQ
jgi:acyl-CoA thioesterase FadM